MAKHQSAMAKAQKSLLFQHTCNPRSCISVCTTGAPHCAGHPHLDTGQAFAYGDHAGLGTWQTNQPISSPESYRPPVRASC